MSNQPTNTTPTATNAPEAQPTATTNSSTSKPAPAPKPTSAPAPAKPEAPAKKETAPAPSASNKSSENKTAKVAESTESEMSSDTEAAEDNPYQIRLDEYVSLMMPNVSHDDNSLLSAQRILNSLYRTLLSDKTPPEEFQKGWMCILNTANKNPGKCFSAHRINRGIQLFNAKDDVVLFTSLNDIVMRTAKPENRKPPLKFDPAKVVDGLGEGAVSKIHNFYTIA